MEFRAVMRTNHHLLILLMILFFSFIGEIAAVTRGGELHRKDFPGDFTFGTASSAYQYEGAVREGGRGPSIWDTYTHRYPERIADKSNGDIAIDFYHRYKEDIKMMKHLGFDSFRLSISWPRILPNGSLSGGVNKDGVHFYNNLINELISNDIKPFVTLFHWDVPQPLEDKYGGFLSPQIVLRPKTNQVHHVIWYETVPSLSTEQEVTWRIFIRLLTGDDFVSFAGVCFREFGDRVKHWITMNEPLTFAVNGYARGSFPPGRCSVWTSGKCSTGDSGREPYNVAHHIILAHAASVKLYRQNFQASQKGQIGITLVSYWIIPYSNSKEDKEATIRGLDFVFGWYMDPLTLGDYPSRMREHVGPRLPKFTKNQTEMIKGSYDFIGINYYTSIYAHNLLNANGLNRSFDNDYSANLTAYRQGVPIGPQAASKWLFVYPRGIYDLLVYTKAKYNNPVIYITENGISDLASRSLPIEKALKDDARVDFYRQHLKYVQKANRKGVDVRGFFAWSLFDNFEWTDGYTFRFGICYVDYKDGLKRYLKNSALWFKRLLS